MLTSAAVKGTGVGGRIRQTGRARRRGSQKAPAAPALPRPRRRAASTGARTGGAGAAGPSARHDAEGQPDRQLTAKKTRESLQTTAQLTQTHEVDA